MTQQEIIQKFMAALYETDLQGTAALDEAVSSASIGIFASTQAVIDKMKTDIAETGDAEKFLRDSCGIDFERENFPASATENLSQQKITANSFKVENSSLTIKLARFSDDNELVAFLDFDDLSAAQKIIWQSLHYRVENSISLVKKIYGENFGFGASSLLPPKTIYFGFYDRADNCPGESGAFYDAKGKTSLALMLQINMKFFGESGAQNLDKTLAHEFTHCAMMANINYFDYLPQFIKEGAAEYTCGGESIAFDHRNIIFLADKSALAENGAGKSRIDTALDLADTGTGAAISYVGGYMFLRYFARQVTAYLRSSAASFEFGVAYSSEFPLLDASPLIRYVPEKIADFFDAFFLDSGDDDDTISSGKNDVTIFGGDGDDTIYNWGNAVTISGGAGNDTISGYNYYSTIDGGSAEDSLPAGISFSSSATLTASTKFTGEDEIFAIPIGAKFVKVHRRRE